MFLLISNFCLSSPCFSWDQKEYYQGILSEGIFTVLLRGMSRFAAGDFGYFYEFRYAYPW